ncbi:MAG: alpha/beta fold hydrolase [Bacteroidia bacterium]|nr:alpha/beta fold hydrolase [Bacteroidia bacterium]
MNLWAWITLFGLGLGQLAAQELPRKAWFGAQLSDADGLPGRQTGGVRIVRVVGGTSMRLQAQDGDVLLELNRQPVQDLAGFMTGWQSLYEGDEVRLTLLRNEKQLVLKGTCDGRPRETDPVADILYESAPYRGGRLRVLINRPRSPGPHPALLFIPGYTCSSIDGMGPDHPYTKIVKAFSDAGYVVLRIEKSGLGDSRHTPPCESCSLADEIDGFEQGLLKLKSLPYVDTSNVFIFGHSMGGIVAPALSAKHRVKGVMVYGTTAKSWFEYQLELNRLQGMLAHPDPAEYEASCRDQAELAYAYFIQRTPLETLARDPHTDSLLRAYWEYDGQGRIFGRNAEYWRQIQDMPLIGNWLRTDAFVRVMWGGTDFQAFSRADHEQIVYSVNHAHPGRASFRAFPETDHTFARTGTMQLAYELLAQQQIQELFDRFDPEVPRSCIAWADSIRSGGTSAPDAGPAWEKLATEPYPGKQDDICFIDERLGWYVNGGGNIWHTRDGGDTWTRQLSKPGTFFRCIAFIDSLTGFAGTVGTGYFPNVTDTIPLYRTRDGGRSWQPVSYTGPYVKGLCAIQVLREPYINHGQLAYRCHLYAAGRVGSPANLMVSHDGGETFTSRSMQADCRMLFDIRMLSPQEGIACAASSEDIAASNALMLRTEDGGLTWTPVYRSARPYETTWKVSFPTPSVGYATIQSYNPDPAVRQQRIIKTTDGGRSWQELNLVEDPKAREFGIGFIDELHGYVGTLGSGYETRDGGLSWQPADLGRACNNIRFYRTASGRLYGYAIGVEVLRFR